MRTFDCLCCPPPKVVARAFIVSACGRADRRAYTAVVYRALIGQRDHCDRALEQGALPPLLYSPLGVHIGFRSPSRPNDRRGKSSPRQLCPPLRSILEQIWVNQDGNSRCLATQLTGPFGLTRR